MRRKLRLTSSANISASVGNKMMNPRMTMILALIMQTLGAIGLYIWGFLDQSFADFGYPTLWTTKVFVGFLGSISALLCLFVLSAVITIGIVMRGKSERQMLAVHIWVICGWFLLLVLQASAIRTEVFRPRGGVVVGQLGLEEVPNHPSDGIVANRAEPSK